MNNFTKEYIKECNCKEVQYLSLTLKRGDWIGYLNSRYIDLVTGVCNVDSLVIPANSEGKTSNVVWLPTGDQLDEEIIKICKASPYYDYEFLWQPDVNDGDTFYAGVNRQGNLYESNRNPNPLIAKIKLLKELLK